MAGGGANLDKALGAQCYVTKGQIYDALTLLKSASIVSDGCVCASV